MISYVVVIKMSFWEDLISICKQRERLRLYLTPHVLYIDDKNKCFRGEGDIGTPY